MAQEAGQGQILTATRGPWTGGYTSSVPAFMARPDQLIGDTAGSDTNSSRDVNIDPFTGAASRRAGCAIYSDTISGGSEVTGLLTAKWGAKCRRLSAITHTNSNSSATNNPALMALFGEDTNSGFPSADAGFNATLWVRNESGTNKNYALGQEFSGTQTYGNSPSTYNTAATYRWKMIPMWVDSGSNGVYNRAALTGTAGTDKFNQQFMACGSRAYLDTQNWLYAPNLRMTPWRWNKRFNESGSSGSQTVRIYPTGPLPPLFPPTAAVTNSSGDSTGTSWSDGDTYYISVLFIFEDGSPSAPFIPRAVNSILTGGNGLVTVGTIGGTKKYQSMTYTNIALGPEGTTKRVLLRTVKQNRTATTDNITVAPLDLRIIGVLNNNTQKTYVDYGGDDDSLLEDDDVVGVDWTMPRRARFIGTGDQRAIVSYTLPNTAAIVLAPVSINNDTTYDRNVADDDTNAYGSSGSYVRITSTDLELHYNAGAAPAYATADATASVASMHSGTDNAVKFPFATFTTVESLVDAINKTISTGVTASNCRMWKAQIAPGIDPTMASTNLSLTTMDIACTTTDQSTTVNSSSLFGPVGPMMKVSGTSITAGTYVVSKTTASIIQISDQALNPGAGAVTLTFYSDTGDEGFVTGGTHGYLRAFCPSFGLLLHMQASAFPGSATPDMTSVYFTNASPGAASSGISLAPNSFTAQNRRLPSPNPNPITRRMCMGIVDIEGAAIVAYSDGIYMFANQRGANTGEDFDCRLFDVNNTRGCISYLGLCAGNGWAAYATEHGIVATDKNRREFVISGDIFNHTEGLGDLTYEVTHSSMSAAGDTDDQYLSLGVRGTRLVARYRNSSLSPCEISYNFSPGVEASGVEELINPDGKAAYIWSPPAIYNSGFSTGYLLAGPIGSVINSSGRTDYFATDSNFGVTGDGRIEKITGVADNTAAYTAFAVVPPVLANPFMAVCPQDVQVDHIRADSTTGTSQLDFANNQVPTFDTSTLTRALPIRTLQTQAQRQIVPIDEAQRGVCDFFWMRWRSNVQVVANRVWRMVLRYTETEKAPSDSSSTTTVY